MVCLSRVIFEIDDEEVLAEKEMEWEMRDEMR